MKPSRLLTFLLLWLPFPSTASETFNTMIGDLETVIERPIRKTEYLKLFEESAHWLNDSLYISVNSRGQSGSTILLCVRGDAEFYLGTSIAACVDPFLNRYYVTSVDAGLQVGISITAFTLIYQSFSGARVTGIYMGGKAGGAVGQLGGSLGLFYRSGRSQRADRLYWIGYVAGAVFDISGGVLQISRF